VADSFEKWAVVAFQQEGVWQVEELPPTVADDLEDVVAAVRGQAMGAIALVDIADEFFVAVRWVGGQERMLLSDTSAAASWDLAAQVMDRLEIDVPNDDELDEVWPTGDLGLFADLGLDEMEQGAILSDVEAYADEILATLARRLGFADAYERVMESLVV
jgi:putative tRNA adenosine deaminase-associated protein